MSIGSRIKEFAKKEHNGIGILAKKMGIAPSQLSQYTSEARKPSAEILTKLANLGADINYILTGEHYMDEEAAKSYEERLKAIEARITELEALNFRKDEQIRKLEEENKQLRVQYIAITKAAESYGKNHLGKG